MNVKYKSQQLCELFIKQVPKLPYTKHKE